MQNEMNLFLFYANFMLNPVQGILCFMLILCRFYAEVLLISVSCKKNSAAKYLSRRILQRSEDIYSQGPYQERPLKMLDCSNGTNLPLNDILLELKFGLMFTVALLSPLVSVMNICAEMPTP